MPYVEVWIDDPECAGDCRSAKEFRARADEIEERIKEAVALIEGGDVTEALHVLRGEFHLCKKSRPDELKSKYELLKRGKLPGWTLA